MNYYDAQLSAERSAQKKRRRAEAEAWLASQVRPAMDAKCECGPALRPAPRQRLRLHEPELAPRQRPAAMAHRQVQPRFHMKPEVAPVLARHNESENMIKPTIGRVIWYYPPGVEHTEQPFPALIAYVQSDDRINVGGFDNRGKPFSDTEVLLLQEGYGNPGGGAWACWMPYQKGQAAKHESRPPLTDADAAADLAGTPRPDHPTIAA